MLRQDARVSGPCLSDGRVRTDEVILAENEGRKVLPVGMHSADLARAPARCRRAGHAGWTGGREGKPRDLTDLLRPPYRAGGKVT